jgi:type IV secretion system protein VirB9
MKTTLIGRAALFVLIVVFSLGSCASTKKPAAPLPQLPNPSRGTGDINTQVDFNKAQQPDPQAKPAADSAAAAQTPPPQSAAPTSADNKIVIKVVDYQSSEEKLQQSTLTMDNKEKLAADPSEVVQRQNMTFEIKPSVENYSGGAVVFQYIPNHVYRLYVAPMMTTNIELAPGEKMINAPYAGDTVNFKCGQTFFIENGKERQQVLIKAVYSGKTTTLNIPTDQRNYMFNIVALPKTFMPLVSFDYPLEMAESMKALEKSKENDILMHGKITDLDFGYKILPHSIHLPKWQPSIVFNDGEKTYLNFASASRASYAPVLFEVTDKGQRELVNYRVRGTYYIVDRVLMHFELILDVNEGNTITVIHEDK